MGTGWPATTRWKSFRVDEYGVIVGLDVGKSEHHAVGLDRAGGRVFDAPLPNSEPKLRAMFDKLAAHGPVLVVVDQPATVGALPVAVARACGHDVAYLPGLAMRRIADLYPGDAKTDARDAFIIADAARTLPHTLRRVDTDDEALAELSVLAGYDDDLATETTRISNRIRGLLTGLHPGLERVLGPRITHPAVLEILIGCGGPAGIRAGPPQTRRDHDQACPQDGPETPRRHPVRAGRAGGCRSRHRRGRHRAGPAGPNSENSAGPARNDRCRGRGDP